MSKSTKITLKVKGQGQMLLKSNHFLGSLKHLFPPSCIDRVQTLLLVKIPRLFQDFPRLSRTPRTFYQDSVVAQKC